MDENIKKAALRYHSHPTPGKVAIKATKPMTTQRDLALAYSPGVAIPCEEIAKDPLKALDYTSRGNVVAVISNGTAVLGLGNIGGGSSGSAARSEMSGPAAQSSPYSSQDSRAMNTRPRQGHRVPCRGLGCAGMLLRSTNSVTLGPGLV